MNRILSKFSLVIALTLITAGVWAQTQTKAMRATIPFDFVINNKLVPAGTYTVSSATASSEIVKFSNPAGKEQLFSSVVPESPGKGQENALVFHKYGDRYFLSEIRCQNCSMNSSLPVSKTEKWARIQTQDTAVTEWPANDILIALK